MPTRNHQFKEVEVLDLPNILVHYNAILGNKIKAAKVVYRKPTTGDTRGPGAVRQHVDGDDSNSDSDSAYESAYDQEADFATRFADNVEALSGAAVHTNVPCLAHGRLRNFAYVGRGDYAANALQATPVITKRMVGKTFETVKEKLLKR